MVTHLDDILVKFSIFGRYYVRCMVLMFLCYTASNMNCTNFIFVTEEVGYRCKDERHTTNAKSRTNSTEACTEWLYDDPHSFVSEFQLATQDWKRTLVGTIRSIGYMFGLLIMGPLSDKLGRKKIIVASSIIAATLGVTKSYTNWYWIFITSEFLEAAFGDSSSPSFMLTIEIVSHKSRLLYQMLCGFGFAFGFLSLAVVAWLFPYWRIMLRVIYWPSVLFFFYYYLLDESPRWFLSRGHEQEAVKVLRKIAKINKTKISNEELENIYYENTKDIGFIVLLKKTFTSRTLLKRFCICLSWWATSTFVNYGMQITSVSLAGNKYINFGLLTVVEIIGSVSVVYTMKKLGRKIPLIGAFILTAVFCFAFPFVPTNFPWLSILLFMVGKLMSSAYFCITYIYTSELFPTYTRNSMHALCSSLGRIGSIVAPQVPLLKVYWDGLPSLVFGCASLVAGLATMFAPNTANDALPDTVRQAEALGAKSLEERSTRIPLALL